MYFLRRKGEMKIVFLYNVLTNVFVKYIKQKFLSKNVFSKKTAEEGDDKERGNFLQTSPYFSMGWIPEKKSKFSSFCFAHLD